MQKFLRHVNFGEVLQKLRKSKNFSQEGLIIKMELEGRNMSRSNYANIEQGRRNIYINDFMLIMEILGADYNEFFASLKSAANKHEET